jgi:hypothetical protein
LGIAVAIQIVLVMIGCGAVPHEWRGIGLSKNYVGMYDVAAESE